MVVGGITEKSEALKHAGEVSTMALDLLSTVSNFKIRHRPNTKLQLRIGIHSGENYFLTDLSFDSYGRGGGGGVIF